MPCYQWGVLLDNAHQLHLVSSLERKSLLLSCLKTGTFLAVGLRSVPVLQSLASFCLSASAESCGIRLESCSSCCVPVAPSFLPSNSAIGGVIALHNPNSLSYSFHSRFLLLALCRFLFWVVDDPAAGSPGLAKQPVDTILCLPLLSQPKQST